MATQSLGSVLGCAPPRQIAAGSLLGLEHEYQVLVDGVPIDFRELIHSLPIHGLRIDPGDVNAYRLPTGLALTADSAEAEIASPPIDVRPGFAREVEAWASEGRRTLEAALPAGHTLAGYSTHISIAMPDDIVDAVADLYSLTFAPAFALLIEGPSSNGVYVRPRPGRLELCGEFVEGPRLGAVAAFAAGTARACAAAIRGERTGQPDRPRLCLERFAGVERYGIRVHRFAAGFDLYAGGRSAAMPVEGGGSLGAQELLSASQSACRDLLAADASADDLHHFIEMVQGSAPLGVEVVGPEPRSTSLTPAASPFGRAVAPVERPGFRLLPALATWDFVLHRLETSHLTAFVLVPRSVLTEFSDLLTSGALDATLTASLDQGPDQHLASYAQTWRPGIYRTVTPELAGLLPPERPVQPAASFEEPMAPFSAPLPAPSANLRPAARIFERAAKTAAVPAPAFGGRTADIDHGRAPGGATPDPAPWTIPGAIGTASAGALAAGAGATRPGKQLTGTGALPDLVRPIPFGTPPAHRSEPAVPPSPLPGAARPGKQVGGPAAIRPDPLEARSLGAGAPSDASQPGEQPKKDQPPGRLGKVLALPWAAPPIANGGSAGTPPAPPPFQPLPAPFQPLSEPALPPPPSASESSPAPIMPPAPPTGIETLPVAPQQDVDAPAPPAATLPGEAGGGFHWWPVMAVIGAVAVGLAAIIITMAGSGDSHSPALPPTATLPPTVRPTETPRPAATRTATAPTPADSATATLTESPIPTPSAVATPSPAGFATPLPTKAPIDATVSPTGTAAPPETPAATPTASATPLPTETPASTATATPSSTATPTRTATPSPTRTPTLAPTRTPTSTPTPACTPSAGKVCP